MKLHSFLAVQALAALAASLGLTPGAFAAASDDTARSGDATAQRKLARAYWQGKGAGRSLEQAFALMSKAARAGNLDAQVDLGIMYERGEGTAQDTEAAMRWYKKSAAAGNGSAQCVLGGHYLAGTGVAKDSKRAIELFKAAAAHGQPCGYHELGRLYAQGAGGVAADDHKAADYFVKAILSGEPMALADLDGIQMMGDLKKHWSPLPAFNAAARAGNKNGEYILGHLYLEGDFVGTDYKQARRWLTKAAQHGHPTAQCDLGLMLIEGVNGVAKDAPQGIKWLKLAAEQGDNLAREGLVKVYRDGMGVPKNPAEAKRWQSAPSF